MRTTVLRAEANGVFSPRIRRRSKSRWCCMKTLRSISLFSMRAVAAASVLAGFQAAHAADLPPIKADAANPVPACATPGRLQAFLAKRNGALDPRFKSIALDYMKEGEALGLRWDYAFFQMLLETGNLSYERGSRINGVKAEQNNFAGLRPIEKNAHYESFPDTAAGARAHLQHVALYAGEKVATPVSQRTRRVQEMGMLASWRETISHAPTFGDLAGKWTDGSNSYAERLKDIASKFEADFCNAPDPQPEIAGVRNTTPVAAAPVAAANAAPAQEKVSGLELARRALEDGSDRRSALGASAAAGPMPVKILNAPQADITAPNAAAASLAPQAAPVAPEQPARLPVPQLPKASTAQPPAVKTAAVGAAAAKIVPSPSEQPRIPDAAPRPPEATVEPPATPQLSAVPDLAAGAPQKCRVFTASYGGHRAVIVKAMSDQVANFTVLDVNEGQEAREAEAFISAYAKGGAVAGQFATQDKALEKAFELCPEG